MKRIVALLITTVMLCTACGSQIIPPSATTAPATASPTEAPTPAPTADPTPTPTEEPTATPAPTPVPTPTPTPPPPPSLTSGLQSGREYRPVCVMIENQTQCREQQAGLSEADIVYEALEEGKSMTRFVAVYNDNLTARVGPVRSCRIYYVDIASEYKGVLAFFGGPENKTDRGGAINPKVRSAEKAGLIQVGANGIGSKHGKYFPRDTKYPNPHNVFVDLNRLVTLLTKPLEPVSHFQFNADAEFGGDAANSIRIVYNKNIIDVKYTYDPTAKNYKRSQEKNGSPMIDANTKKQITVTNVIVQYAKCSYLGNKVGRSLINFTLTGTGTADIFVAGKHIKATWKRPALKDITKYYDEKGKEITLLPGNTWVQIVPTDKKVPVTYTK